VESLASLVCQGFIFPSPIWLDIQEIEDSLKPSLKDIHCSLVILVFFFNIFRLLLCSIHFIHYIFKLDSPALELILTGITDTIVPVPLNLPLNISDFFNKLIMLGVQLAHIVVERIILGLCLLESFDKFRQAHIHAYGFLDCGNGFFELLDFLHGNVNRAGVSCHSPGSSGDCTAKFLGIAGSTLFIPSLLLLSAHSLILCQLLLEL